LRFKADLVEENQMAWTLPIAIWPRAKASRAPDANLK
jgi:hypothetical protein